MKIKVKCLSDKTGFSILLDSLIYCGIAISALFSLTVSASKGAAETPINIQQMSKSAPVQTMHYGRLVGHWEIKDQSLGKDGKWVDGPGANWNFYWILGGSAIQDDWISPGYKTPAPEKGRQFGTNIRIFRVSGTIG